MQVLIAGDHEPTNQRIRDLLTLHGVACPAGHVVPLESAVDRATEALTSRGAPHGLIAISSFLGRGSPQLISRFVRELGNEHLAHQPTSPAIPETVAAQLTRLWELIRAEADTELQLERDRIRGLRAQNAALSDQLGRLQDELQRQ